MQFRWPARSTWLYALFWSASMGVVYLGMNDLLRPKVARATEVAGTRAEVEIEQSRDRHYYVEGTVNGHPVTFMVDTGATTVTLGTELAKEAHLGARLPISLDTAGGTVGGEVTRDNVVTAGGISVGDLQVVVAPTLTGDRPALLGQNFLRHVTVTQTGSRMTLRLPN